MFNSNVEPIHYFVKIKKKNNKKFYNNTYHNP